jgi:phage-related minor tail protein
MGSYISLATTQEQAEIRLAGVLRATGQAAGLSFQEMKKYAGELQNITAVGDEVSLAGMAILSTFKEIKGDQFKEATKAAIDMSVVLDNDLKSSIMQIGKALNDPIRGVSALSEAGVQFTEKQREMITQLVKSNERYRSAKDHSRRIEFSVWRDRRSNAKHFRRKH